MTEIARRVGIHADRVIDGATLDGLTDGQLDELLAGPQEFVFSRAAPEAKLRIADALRAGGNVVVVGSVSGLRGDWGQSGYNATKALIMNFVQSLALGTLLLAVFLAGAYGLTASPQAFLSQTQAREIAIGGD